MRGLVERVLCLCGVVSWVTVGGVESSGGWWLVWWRGGIEKRLEVLLTDMRGVGGGGASGGRKFSG